jgi:hypothetical protein
VKKGKEILLDVVVARNVAVVTYSLPYLILDLNHNSFKYRFGNQSLWTPDIFPADEKIVPSKT